MSDLEANKENVIALDKPKTESVNMTTNPMICVVAPSATKESDTKPKEQGNKQSVTNGNNNKNEDDNDDDLFAMNDNNTGWRCACENGFLPPGMLKSFGSAEAMMRLGTGQCYHKQK